MKLMRTLLNVLLALLAVSLAGPRALAQEDGQPLPPGLSRNSSLSEVLNWLNKNSFPVARIGLTGNPGAVDYVTGEVVSTYEGAVFSQGFKLVWRDGCHLKLHNDDFKLLEYSTTALPSYPQSLKNVRKEANPQKSYPADLYIRLNRVSQDRYKAPHLHTSKQERGKLLGWWRAEFKKMRGVSNPDDVLLLVIPDRSSGYRWDQMYGTAVTFTFDDAVASEQFFAAFGRAVRLCHVK
jgi:hypothetical protein